MEKRYFTSEMEPIKAADLDECGHTHCRHTEDGQQADAPARRRVGARRRPRADPQRRMVPRVPADDRFRHESLPRQVVRSGAVFHLHRGGFPLCCYRLRQGPQRKDFR